MRKNILQEKSYKFALDSIQLYKQLINEKEFVISKQLLRSATSVGANIRESKQAFSKKDFIFKLSISLKECDESIYWLELLKDSNYIQEDKFNYLSDLATEILKILKSSILTAKKNMHQESIVRR